MQRNLLIAVYLLFGLSLSCAPASFSERNAAGEARGKSSTAPSLPASNPVDSQATRTLNTTNAPAFADQTQEIVTHARKLIQENERQGAVLDQRWYGFRRFGNYQELILRATQVTFFGGREADVRSYLGNQYASIDPIEEDLDPGEVRLYAGRRSEGTWDFIIIGQNGREVALKTVIRLLYLGKFLDEGAKQKYRERLQSFPSSLRVLMSSVSARQEFVDFFNRHGIREPDAVVIGFMGDSSAVMRDDGVEQPRQYSDESLRVNWYPNARGKRVLLVSINGNRIFASRAGQLVEALLEISSQRPPVIVFLGSAGAIEAPELVWKIVTPMSVTNGDLVSQKDHELVRLVQNRAAGAGSTQTAHASVESVVIETTAWAANMKRRGIKTIDQELLHIIEAAHSSKYADRLELFVGILVTDNISSNASLMDMTLEHAEDTITLATDLRRVFLSKILNTIGVLKHEHKQATSAAGGER